MKQIVALLLFLMLVNSCMYKKLRYVHDENEIRDSVYRWDNHPPDYLIKPADILYVKISSTNKEISTFFELQAGQTNVSGSGGMGSAYFLDGFTVNDSGNIVMPVLGNIRVEGKTIKEIENIVQMRTNELLQHAISTVRMVSFNITFLGEVSRQGKFVIMQDNVNILDAMALAGGVSDYGNRKNILIIRQTKTGTKSFRLDLTDRKLLGSENYYLVPNDIIVVEPLRTKSFQLGVRDYTLLLTTVTSTVTMIILIANLFK